MTIVAVRVDELVEIIREQERGRALLVLCVDDDRRRKYAERINELKGKESEARRLIDQTVTEAVRAAIARVAVPA